MENTTIGQQENNSLILCDSQSIAVFSFPILHFLNPVYLMGKEQMIDRRKFKNYKFHSINNFLHTPKYFRLFTHRNIKPKFKF